MVEATPTQFNDGKAYERSMGRWSRMAGEILLDWLALPPGLRWIDVACGNGAFTELLVHRCQPVDVQGIDVSEGQLSFARERLADRAVTFHQGDAQALPFEDDEFDAAVMALAINLVPDRAKAVAEMARVVRPGGTVATYMWDLNGGGFPMEPIREAREQQRGVVRSVLGHLEYLPHVRYVRDHRFGLPSLWCFEHVHWMSIYQPPLNRMGESLVQGHMDVPHGLRRPAARQQLPLHALDMHWLELV